MTTSGRGRTTKAVRSRSPGERRFLQLVLIGCSYAPFGAFSERKLGKAGVLASNPGPGSYDAVGYATQLNAEAKTAVSSQPFVSKVHGASPKCSQHRQAPRVAKQTAGSSVYKESSIKENPGMWRRRARS